MMWKRTSPERDWLLVASWGTIPNRPRQIDSKARAAKRWRNAIITILIEMPELSRRRLHDAVSRTQTSSEETEIDLALTGLVRAGDIYRPRHGRYSLTPARGAALKTAE